MSQFNLFIITPDKKLYEGQAQAVSVPGQEGEMSILKRHAPLLAALKKGKVIVTDNSSRKEFEIESGVIEVDEKKVVILAR